MIVAMVGDQLLHIKHHRTPARPHSKTANSYLDKSSQFDPISGFKTDHILSDECNEQ